MTLSSPSETKQQHPGHEPSVHGEAPDYGHSGEGAASALAHMISLDLKRWKQSRDPEEASARSGHP